jgi:mRNA-degrading endonuclease YafQ of YafQ-DinJ toxin-antitoxin module
MNLELAPSFVRMYRNKVKHNVEKERTVKVRIEQFRLNPKNPLLRVHKLKGYKEDTWSFSVGYNLRILFTKKDNTVLLVDIGTHDEVY